MYDADTIIICVWQMRELRDSKVKYLVLHHMDGKLGIRVQAIWLQNLCSGHRTS